MAGCAERVRVEKVTSLLNDRTTAAAAQDVPERLHATNVDMGIPIPPPL